MEMPSAMRLLIVTLAAALVVACAPACVLADAPNAQPPEDHDSDHNLLHPLILGGTEVPVGQKTYTCGLRETVDDIDFCGGSLISPMHVLTAAHCAARSVKFVSVGSHFVQGAQDGQQIAVKKQTIHPNFTASNYSWDFMVLELEKAVSGVRPVGMDLLTDSKVVDYEMATVMGWGVTYENGKRMSNVLLAVDVEMQPNRACAQMLNTAIDDSMLCAGGRNDEGSCSGDSGGPLVVSTPDRDVLVGVVSWGRGCGRGDGPTVYARVSKAMTWIMQVIFHMA